MSVVTLCHAGAAEGWWIALISWAFARALTRAIPLESFRQAVGRANDTLGYLVTCAPCASSWVAFALAVVIGQASGWPAGVAAWGVGWSGALLLDAAWEFLSARAASQSRTPKDWPVACNACGGRLAGLTSADLAVIVTANGVLMVHRECPGAQDDEPRSQQVP